MRGADINTTHYLVRGYVSIKLKCPQKRKKGVKRPALNHLRDKSRSKEYSDKIAERFSEDNAEISSLEDKWIKLRDTINEVSFEVLGEKDRKNKEDHISKKTKDLLVQRGDVKKKSSSADNRVEYSRLNGLVRNSCKRDDIAWAARIADELEDAAKNGQQRDVWQKIRVLANGRKTNVTAVRDKDGKLISDPKAQSDRWAEYFEEMLNSC